VPTNLVMVTSALPGEGKTFCAINLAISIALEMDRTVLLVDADFAKPSIPQALGLEADRGLMDVLVDPRIDLADVLWKTTIDKLMLLPAGTMHQHATELLASEAMGTLLREMAERYRERIIVFDSAPLLAASEASALAHHMGQIVMIVEAGRTTERALKEAVSRVESSNVVGLVLNKGVGRARGYGGDYGYG
jgi:exopolysaccharide/PEP-CTERM locus tyrosine autokinase